MSRPSPPPAYSDAPDLLPTLPCHAQGEVHLLSSLLGHGRAVAEQVSPILTDADFHFAKHRAIYSAIMKVFAEGQEILPVTVAEVLSRQGGAFRGDGGIDELTRMADAPPAERGAVPTAKLLLNYRIRRDIIAAAQKSAALAADMQTSQDAVLSKSVALMQQAAVGSTKTSRTETAPAIGRRVMAAIAERRSVDSEILGIPTGLRTWDLQVNGIIPRKLYTLAGATGMGKTAAMVTMMDGTTAADSPSIVFTLEMENDAIWHRCLAMKSGVDSRRIANGQMSLDELADVEAANRYWCNKPLQMNDWAGMTVRDIEAATREFVTHVSGKLPPIVWIDFAQIIADIDERNTNEALKIQRNVYALREMAKNLNLGLVLMAQLNRNVDTREDKRPKISDISDSAGIAKASDTITMLYRPAYYQRPEPTASASDEADIVASRFNPADPDEAEWIVAKGRDGGTRTLRMTYHPTKTRFTAGGLDYVHEAAPAPQNQPAQNQSRNARKATF